MKILKNSIIEAIKTIYDPEIPVNIYDLGMIYDIEIKEDNMVNITMTLTSPNCPEAEHIPSRVYDTVSQLAGISEVEVQVTFDPPWTKDRISPDAMLELGLL